MLFRHNRPEYSDGVIDLIPMHIGAPNRELGFGHEQIWKITLHNERQEIEQISYRDPDNEPSRKTCEKLGCLFERIADVPEDIYRKFEISQQKCRYIWHPAGTDGH